MLKCKMPKFLSSIFVKLLVFVFIAGLGINLAIVFFLGAYRHHIAGSFQPLLRGYINYLVDDIGVPPNVERARQIAAKSKIVISYEGKDQTWTTAGEPLTLPLHRFRIRHESESVQVSSYRGAFRVAINLDEARLVFLLPHQAAAEKKVKVLGICLLIYITTLMVGAYFAIRWLLKPLRWLKQGVDQVGQGELSHRVPLKHSDELRDLSASFNTMTERLQQLIQSKEQLLLDVSHELRSPMTRMKVALALMPDSPDKKSIEEDLKEMERKITELLETARALNIESSPNYGPVDLVELIRKTARKFANSQPAITIAPMPDLTPVLLDEALIRKALANLLENAQKFSPDDRPPIEIAMAAQDAEVLITIQDHGIGISPEDLNFIFEPFYRANKARTPQRDGFGLGLSLVKNIIEAHSGNIEISSTLNQGTQVDIRLPRTRPPSDHA